MTSLTIVLLILRLQAVMGLEEPIKKCSVPNKFEGKFKFTVKIGTQRIRGTGTTHVDYTIGQSATSETFVLNGETTDFSIDISNNIGYTAIPSENTCKKTDNTVLPGVVPPGKLLHIKRGELQGVRVQIWEFSLNPGKESETLYLTEDKCMFVKLDYVQNEENGQRVYMTEDYYDMKEGIKDTSVFELPKNCVKHTNYYRNSHRLPQSNSSSSLRGFYLLIICVVFLGKHLG